MASRTPALLIGLALSFAAGCSSSNESGGSVSDDIAKSALARDTNPNLASGAVQTVAHGNNAFGFDLSHALARTQGTGENFFFSPYSVSVALAMTYAGATGSTATQLAGALHFTLPSAELHPAFDALDLALASRASVAQRDNTKALGFQLSVADSIWVDRAQALRSPFLDTLAVNYGAGVNLVDFVGEPDAARGMINQWVADRTDDKIENLLGAGSVDPSTRLVLVNAVYFLAPWATPFEAKATAPAAFHPATGAATQVATMHSESSLSYAETDSYQAVDVPYLGDQVSMLVLVPKGDVGTLESSLDADALDHATAALAPTLVTLSLPKFRIAGASIELSETLKSLGMSDAFDSKADFSGITGDRSLYISHVTHKAYVDVDESGTEAAAATAVTFTNGAAEPPSKSATVNVDHPFLFFIRDIPTGAVLFAGRVANPS